MAATTIKPMDILEKLRLAEKSPADWDVPGLLSDAFDEIVKTRSQVNVLLLGNIHQFADDEGYVWYAARGINRGDRGPIFRSLDDAIAVVRRCHCLSGEGLAPAAPSTTEEATP